jgi:hypothetical protein
VESNLRRRLRHLPTNSWSRSVLYGSIVRCAGISGLFQEFRDEGFTWARIARAPLLRSAYGAPMGAFSTDRRAAVRRGVLGLGSQERYPRILEIAGLDPRILRQKVS